MPERKRFNGKVQKDDKIFPFCAEASKGTGLGINRSLQLTIGKGKGEKLITTFIRKNETAEQTLNVILALLGYELIRMTKKCSF